MRSSLLLIYLCTLAFKSCSGRGWAIPSKSRKKAGIFIQYNEVHREGERGAKVRLVCKGVLRMHHMPILPLSVVLNPELSLQIFRFGWINLYQPTPSYPVRIFFFFFCLIKFPRIENDIQICFLDIRPPSCFPEECLGTEKFMPRNVCSIYWKVAQDLVTMELWGIAPHRGNGLPSSPGSPPDRSSAVYLTFGVAFGRLIVYST